MHPISCSRFRLGIARRLRDPPLFWEMTMSSPVSSMQQLTAAPIAATGELVMEGLRNVRREVLPNGLTILTEEMPHIRERMESLMSGRNPRNPYQAATIVRE